jgi:predicted Zn-dependent protease
LEAAGLLVRNGQTVEALQMLDQAARVLPQNREILLMKTTTLELAHQAGAAENLLKQIQNRWPEWHAGWVAQGIILGTRGRFEEARRALETAVTLGARSPEVYYCLADFTLRSAPKSIGAAEAAAQQALKLAPEDPWIHSLAGRIASEKGEYPTAVERLREALRLDPRLTQARVNLARAYAALGREQEARAELDAVKGARRGSSEPVEEPPHASRLFQGRPPQDW